MAKWTILCYCSSCFNETYRWKGFILIDFMNEDSSIGILITMHTDQGYYMLKP